MTNRRNEELRAVDTAGPLHCTPVAAGPVSDIAAMDMAFRLRVLSHPVRIKLLSMLFAASRGEECGRVLASTIGLPETTISHHLRQLRLAGFIESRRRGMHIYHRPHPRALNALSATLDPDAERVSGVPESRIDEQPGDRRDYRDNLRGAIRRHETACATRFCVGRLLSRRWCRWRHRHCLDGDQHRPADRRRANGRHEMCELGTPTAQSPGRPGAVAAGTHLIGTGS